MSIFADRMTLRSVDDAFTREVGRTLGALCEGGEILALVGELGAGKTTFVKGLAEGLGVEDTRQVTSPTFLRIQEYEGRVPIQHVDAYRMEDGVSEFSALGGDELLESGAVVVIEWAEKLFGSLPAEFLTLRFSHGANETERLIRIVPRGLRFATLAAALVRDLAVGQGEVTDAESTED